MNFRNRRHFLGSLAAASGLLATRSLPAANGTAHKGFLEAARDLPVNNNADVIVCGAGPAGVTAAITAARAGAKVRLFETHGSLGGVWTSSLLGYLLDFDKPGFNVELVRRLRERDAINGGGMNGLSYQPEEMKLLLEELCSDAGVKVQLHTRVAAAYREGRTLRTIVTESKSGRQAWRAPVFIDTTGDGDLGAHAGCEFEIGLEKACPCQPMTMYALLVVKDVAQIADCIHGTGDGGRHVGPKAFQDTLKRAGVTPSYGHACLFPIQGNLVLLMANHEYGINATDAAQVTEATLRARGEIHQIVRGLRKLGGPWDGVQVAATPEQIGVRDGRRIKGRYVMTSEDLVKGAVQPDAVVRATFPVDIHALSAEDNKKAAYHNAGVKTKPYDIPLRALIARDVDGLFVGGLMDCSEFDGIAKHWYQLGGEFCHASVATLPGGDVLFFGNWENEMRVYRISGWNGWQRQSGKLQITKPAAAHTGLGLTATTFEDAGLTKQLGVAVAPGIDVTWSMNNPAPAAIRWNGMLLPDYGPAYKGPWSEQKDKDAFDGASRGARDNQASVTFRFRGSSIRVIGKTGPNGGFADITLNGQPQPQFDCYSPEVKRDAVLFAKDGLPDGDHEVTITVVGWHGKPRNKASSDSWVHVDKFIVDGHDYDDAGLPHTFTATTDGTVTLLVDRSPVLEQTEAKPSREELTGKPIKLLRRRHPISLTHTTGHEDGGIKLEWSSPLQPRQMVPSANLYPVTPR